MSEKPIRVQLSRAKGWRMPPNTVSVARGPRRIWGNPFTVENAIHWARVLPRQAHAHVVACYRLWLHGSSVDWMGRGSDAARAEVLARLPELRGKNLACWCPLDQPCHADVLLELANESQNT
jgi:hypothetical protein